MYQFRAHNSFEPRREMARLSLLLPGALALVLSPPYERSIPRDAPLEALALIDVREATLPPPIGRTRATLHVRHLQVVRCDPVVWWCVSPRVVQRAP